ncbi:hypothetical protein Tco_1392327 [Tanacetum coccineum]
MGGFRVGGGREGVKLGVLGEGGRGGPWGFFAGVGQGLCGGLASRGWWKGKNGEENGEGEEGGGGLSGGDGDNTGTSDDTGSGGDTGSDGDGIGGSGGEGI